MIIIILVLVVLLFVANMIRKHGNPGDENKFWMALTGPLALVDLSQGAWFGGLFCIAAFAVNFFMYRAEINTIK